MIDKDDNRKPMPTGEDIYKSFKGIKDGRSAKDATMAKVQKARAGKWSEIAGDLFPEDEAFNGIIVANTIEVQARDLSSLVARPPTFDATVSSKASNAARERASLKKQIALTYLSTSHFETEMLSGADDYVTNAFLPFLVEDDEDAKSPVIRILDPLNCYYELDSNKRVTKLYQVKEVSLDTISEMFDEKKDELSKFRGYDQNPKLKVIFSYDKNWHTAVAYKEGQQEAVLLAAVETPMNKAMFRIAIRSGPNGSRENPRGHFDDLVIPLLAKNTLARLMVQQTYDTVNAPMAIPNDVSDVPFGPGATIRTSQPEGIRKVPMGSIQEVAMEQQQLTNELNMGAGYPATRTGNSTASIITGQGIDALENGYTSIVSSYQAILVDVFKDLIALCFELDEKIYGDEKKTSTGVDNSVPFEIEYTPSRDIAGDYSINVRYGMGAGLTAQPWLIWMLQAKAANIVSTRYIQENAPFDFDWESENKRIQEEQLLQSTSLAISGIAQSLPAIAAQGGDIMVQVTMLQTVFDRINKGDTILEAFAYANKPKEEPQQPGGPQDPNAQQDINGITGGQGELPPGLAANGTAAGVKPGQQGNAPGSQPTLLNMLSGISADGDVNSSVGLSTRRAV